ncbi:MAG: class I SAM-dependent methyltransferase [Phyllobacterium sp.]
MTMVEQVRAGLAGDNAYDAYVGPPAEYDFMGATQFRLLTALGLREHHKVLDFGCGSLRTGRLLIPYLRPGGYHGVEPNQWLIEEALDKEIGRDICTIKRPAFAHGDDFLVPFDVKFDFIVAQSIFSHTSRQQTETAVRSFAGALSPSGCALVTFIEGEKDYTGSEWVYPGCVEYRADTIGAMATACGLKAQRLPWFHPRQTWYALTFPNRQPLTDADLGELHGTVLVDPGFAVSRERSTQAAVRTRELEQEVTALKRNLEAVYSSTSWRITRSLRKLSSLLRGA